MVVVWGCGLGLRGEGGVVVEECHVYIPETSGCGSVECLKVICTYLLRLAVFSDVTQAERLEQCHTDESHPMGSVEGAWRHAGCCRLEVRSGVVKSGRGSRKREALEI